MSSDLVKRARAIVESKKPKEPTLEEKIAKWRQEALDCLEEKVLGAAEKGDSDVELCSLMGLYETEDRLLPGARAFMDELEAMGFRTSAKFHKFSHGVENWYLEIAW